MEDAINLKGILQALRKRLVSIISIVIIAALISAAISFYLITPIYQASTTILVNESKNNNQNVTNSNETITNQAVISTYNVIIKSSAILNIVGKKLDEPMTAGHLKKMITVGSENGSQVLSISVLDTDPIRAAKIANMTASVFQEEIVKIMKIDNISILDKARQKGHFNPTSPNSIQNILIGTVIGLVIGLAVAILLDYLDNTIKKEQDIEKVLNIPVLGVISNAQVPKIRNTGKVSNRKGKTKGESINV